MEEPLNVQTIVQQAVDEYMRQDVVRREPAYKTELQEERRRREQLEKRVNELVEENKQSRAAAAEAQRSGGIRAELQKLGVTKVDLAYKAVQDGVVRNEDGRLVSRGESGGRTAGRFSGEVRPGKSGISAGENRRRDRNDGHAEIGATTRRSH